MRILMNSISCQFANQTLNMKLFIFAVLIVACCAKPQYPAPAYPAAAAEPPMPFDFAWEVKEPEFYNDYAHQSKGDDKGYVSGSYRVVLPDTRTQIVSYKADTQNGYTAEVKYEGEAKYPDSKPGYPAPPKY